MKRWQSLLIGLIISAVFLFFAFRQANIGNMLETFRTARYQFLLLAIVTTIFGIWLRGVRWSVITKGRLSLSDGFWLFNIGFLFNNVLPARLGEVARALLAGRRPRMHVTSALSSIVLERLLDFIGVAALLGVVLLGLPLPEWATVAGGIVGAGSVAGVIVLAISVRRPEWALTLGSKVLGLIPHVSEQRARAFLEPFVHGLGGVADVRTFAASLFLTLFGWFVSGISNWITMLAFWPRVPILVGQLVTGAAGLGVAVPAAPSGVGPLEAAVIAVLTGIHYNADIARSFAFTMHGMNILITSAFGMVGLAREGMSFGQVMREAESVKMEEQQPDQQAPDEASANGEIA